MKIYWDIFFSFFRVGGLTFGGGLAMLPILEKEVCDRPKEWLKKEDVSDYYALAQSAPGIIAINTSVLCGNHIAGVLGGIVAALGVVVPSIIIILIIASLLNNFMSIPAVAAALLGVRSGVCALIFKTVVGLSKKNVVDKITLAMFFAAVLALTFTNISPFVPVVFGAVTGIIAKTKSNKEGAK